MIKIYGPIELQDEWLRGYEACQHIKSIHSQIFCSIFSFYWEISFFFFQFKLIGDENGDQCEWAYDMAKCFDKNNNNFARIWKRSDWWDHQTNIIIFKIVTVRRIVQNLSFVIYNKINYQNLLR